MNSIFGGMVSKYRHFLWNSHPGAGTQSSRKTFSLVAKKQSTSQKAQGSLHIFNPPAAPQLWLGDSVSWLTTMGRRIPAAEEALCVAASLPPAQKRGLGGGERVRPALHHTLQFGILQAPSLG